MVLVYYTIYPLKTNSLINFYVMNVCTYTKCFCRYSRATTTTKTSTITTDGSEFDTLLAVYRPTSAVLNFDTIEEVAFDNNSGSDGEDSALSFDAVAGETYYIVIDGVGGAQGLAVLNIDTIAPCT